MDDRPEQQQGASVALATPRPASEPRSRHSSRGRWSLALGLTLLLGGLGVFGYAGWELWGTNAVSHHRQAETVDQLQQAFADPHGPARVDTGHGLASAIVRIPAFGASYAVPLIDGVTEDDLATGIGHFPETAAPGGIGNFALAAHRITHGEPFANLPDLKPGDTVVVQTRRRVYTYVLDTAGESLRVPMTAGWVLEPRPAGPDGDVEPVASSNRLITLATCAELFHTDDRLIVFGHLQSVTRARR